MPSKATYVFCLVQSDKPPSLRGLRTSIPGAGPPRVFSVEKRLWAVVADAPLEKFSPESLEHDLQDVETVSRYALAHAEVIEFFFRKSTVIPLKLLTLFSTDERVRDHVRGVRARITRLFAQLRGFEEWGVRILVSEETRASAVTLPSGRDYLQTKKQLHDETVRPPQAGIRAARSALKTLGRFAAKVRSEAYPPAGPGRPYVTGASFLVKATRRSAWKREVSRVGADLVRQGHRLEVSGPWPPYHFASR
jgi:hypothetical protein